MWTKKESKSFWKINQRCLQHLRQCQALGKSYNRKPQLSWGVAAMERRPSVPSVGTWPGRRPVKEQAAACLPLSRKAGLAKSSCQIWLTSTNLGLPEAICDWNICLLSTFMKLQKGKGLGKETLKLRTYEMVNCVSTQQLFWTSDNLKVAAILLKLWSSKLRGTGGWKEPIQHQESEDALMHCLYDCEGDMLWSAISGCVGCHAGWAKLCASIA